MTVVGDRYEILERIGGGGMADVFRAHDRTLDRDVAVKVLRPAFAGDVEFIERFHREAEALGAIEHPNIVRVLDYGASADGPFIVMELVTGGTLRDLMRSRGRVDQYAAAQIAAGIANGLEAAHVRGVLHRDLKPDNVLLDEEGRPKVGDFGIARLAAATAITRTGEILGTPQYLAPEQMTGDVVDERVDVYALGVILYEMLTGIQPTGGTTPSEIISRRLRLDPPPLSRLVAVAPALNALVMRALARDPGRRIRRAADLRAGLLSITPPAPRAPKQARSLRLPTLSLAPLVGIFAVIAALVRDGAARIALVKLPSVRLPAPPRVAMPRVALPRPPRLPTVRLRAPSAAPLVAPLAAREPARPAQVAAAQPQPRPRARVVAPRRRSAAPLLAALALLVAFVGGSLALAGARPGAVTPAALATATPAPSTAVLSSTSTPEVTAAPSPSPEPTAEPTPEPTVAPTVAPVPAAPAQVATVAGDPAGAVVTFYQLISGHDFASASGLWSSRMTASYPPQTNIWGRFDATRAVVTRSASVTSASPSTAAVAVDLIETRADGTVRHWVGTWYLVRSGSGWLLDQPGLRAA
jgi:protein kinase-like protein